MLIPGFLLIAVTLVEGQLSYGQSYGNSRRLAASYAQNAHAPYYNNRAHGQASNLAVQQWARPQQQLQQMPATQQGSVQSTWSSSPYQQKVGQALSQQPQVGYMQPSQPIAQQPQWGSTQQGSYAQPAAYSAPSGYAQQAPYAPQQQPQQLQWTPQGQQQPLQVQTSGQASPMNVAPSNVVIEQPPPPKVIFMPPEVHYGPPPPELVEQQTKTVLMCKGTPHTVMGDHQFYSCCNDKLYYWKTETCEDGVVKPANSDQTTQTNAVVVQEATQSPQSTESPVTSLNCNGSTFFVATSERSHYACCGRTLFDMRTSACNNSPITTPAPQNIIRKQAACPLNFLCCDGFTPIPNADERYQCCPGAGPYDTTTQQCVPL